MAEGEKQSEVSPESSKAVLKTVAGRLSRIEAGDLPVIERVNPDGTTGYAVDHTGEMVVRATPRSTPRATLRSASPPSTATRHRPVRGHLPVSRSRAAR